MQFLYAEGEILHFMDDQTYDQIEVQKDTLGDAFVFLKEGNVANIQTFDGRVINVELPIKVDLAVVEAPDVVKGDTQSTVLKEVKLETGAKVQTPMFVKTGDTIVVDTRDGSYVERKK
jgi:elongation factor P